MNVHSHLVFSGKCDVLKCVENRVLQLWLFLLIVLLHAIGLNV